MNFGFSPDDALEQTWQAYEDGGWVDKLASRRYNGTSMAAARQETQGSGTIDCQ